MVARKQRVWPGLPYPLGSTWDGAGTNFAIFSAHAEKVELCLFNEGGRRELKRIPLAEYSHEIWHGYLPDVRPGQLYGYRVYGPYDPPNGHRFNHHKLLLDPYAKALRGTLDWNDAHFGYRVGSRKEDLSFDVRNSAPYMPKCEVIAPAPKAGDERAARTPWHETVLYELHVRGFTLRHPEVAEPARGTFAGLAAPPVIRYLQELGVTAVEILPVHAFVHDRSLIERGLCNYWGYNSIGFFAPHAEYLSTGEITEFTTFVARMHDADIEVILDVVYNHTAEGNQFGPTLCFRGIDNKSYYSLIENDARLYKDFTGTGNSLQLRHPYVLRMVTDSLRYWVQEMGVDGFRFDLATTLARVGSEFNGHASFLDVVAQDPLLSTVKLIAEPWDTGPGGYQLGNFPPSWAEWNDRYRDTVRRFWKGEDGQLPELATRLSGSADLFHRRGRRPWASINFITAHDGFTLADLVSHDRKHNEANQEDNRDGAERNYSWNCGVEGATEDPEILRLRRQQMRNLLATLFLSQGVPMLLAGDEYGRTQGGNNNAYCQDDPTTWFDWEGIGEPGEALIRFTQDLIRLRREHIVFHRHRFFHGRPIPGSDVKDILWLRPDGGEMTEADWHTPEARSIAFLLSGEAGRYHLTERGEPEPDDTFFAILNASGEELAYKLPSVPHAAQWRTLVDTAADDSATTVERGPEGTVSIKPRSLNLFICCSARSGSE